LPESSVIPRPRILHLSGDFPDTITAFKTPVIRSHIDLTREHFIHNVISMNRKSPEMARLLSAVVKGAGRPRLEIEAEPFSYGTALTYHAPGRGIFHATMLRQIGRWIKAQIDEMSKPDLLMGHKLGFEGFAIAEASRLTGIPYGISIQGDSDTKVLAARPDLGRPLARIFHDAAVVFPFSPWALDAVERKLGKRKGPTVLLPCPTDLDEPVTPVPGGQGLITTFHLKNYRRKNLEGMASALRILGGQGTLPELRVIGGGSPAEQLKCETLTGDLSTVHYAGPMDRAQLRQAMSSARGFVMPSLRESFGLVFIEALFAGLPIVYPAGTAVDGYVDNLPFALRVNPRDTQAIAGAMQTLDRDEANLKQQLATWLQSDDARRFTRGAIAHQFEMGLLTAISGR